MMTPVNKILLAILLVFIALPFALAGWVAFIALCVNLAKLWGWL